MSDSRLPQEYSEQERSSLHSRSSHDSDDSLTALELHERPASRGHKGRSFSGSSFRFERDLLPLSASLSEPDEASRSVSGDKTIGLINGTPELASRQKLDYRNLVFLRCGFGRGRTGESRTLFCSERGC
jgi:hypothetical protein